MSLDGIRPDDVYYDKKPDKPKRDAKRYHSISNNISSGKHGSWGIYLKKLYSLAIFFFQNS